MPFRPVSHAWCVVLALLLGACRSPSFQAGATGAPAPAGADANEKAAAPKEPKPSDDGESLEGYLTDPAAVVTQLDGAGHLHVRAGAGTVVALHGPVSQVHVYVVRLPAAAVNGSSQSLQGTLLGVLAPRDDGSLDALLNDDSSDPVVVTTEGKAASGTVDLGAAPQGHAVVSLKVDPTQPGGGTAGTETATATGVDPAGSDATGSSTSTSTSTGTSTHTVYGPVPPPSHGTGSSTGT